MIEAAKRAQFKTTDSIKTTIADFTEIKTALEDAISHYSDKEILNDYSQPWYSNARAHYESKLESVDSILKHLNDQLPKEAVLEDSTASNH